MLADPTFLSSATSDNDLILHAESAARSSIVDPEVASKRLLTDVEDRLVRRTKALEENYWQVRGEIENYVRQLIANDRVNTEPVSSKFPPLQQRASELTKDFEQILIRIRDAPPHSGRRRALLKESERRLKELHDLELQMTSTLQPLQESIERLQKEIVSLEPVWLKIQGAEKLTYKLMSGLLLAEWSATAIRVSFLTLAFLLAVVVDCYTPVTENLLNSHLANRHDIAISILFFAQALLLEPTVAKMKRALARKVFQRMVSTARLSLDRLVPLEVHVVNAESNLASMRKSAP